MFKSFFHVETQIFVPDCYFKSNSGRDKCLLTLRQLMGKRSIEIIPKDAPRFYDIECEWSPDLDPRDMEEVIQGLIKLYQYILKQHVKPEYYKYLI